MLEELLHDCHLVLLAHTSRDIRNYCETASVLQLTSRIFKNVQRMCKVDKIFSLQLNNEHRFNHIAGTEQKRRLNLWHRFNLI